MNTFAEPDDVGRDFIFSQCTLDVIVADHFIEAGSHLSITVFLKGLSRAYKPPRLELKVFSELGTVAGSQMIDVPANPVKRSYDATIWIDPSAAPGVHKVTVSAFFRELSVENSTDILIIPAGGRHEMVAMQQAIQARVNASDAITEGNLWRAGALLFECAKRYEELSSAECAAYTWYELARLYESTGSYRAALDATAHATRNFEHFDLESANSLRSVAVLIENKISDASPTLGENNVLYLDYSGLASLAFTFQNEPSSEEAPARAVSGDRDDAVGLPRLATSPQNLLRLIISSAFVLGRKPMVPHRSQIASEWRSPFSKNPFPLVRASLADIKRALSPFLEKVTIGEHSAFDLFQSFAGLIQNVVVDVNTAFSLAEAFLSEMDIFVHGDPTSPVAIKAFCRNRGIKMLSLREWVADMPVFPKRVLLADDVLRAFLESASGGDNADALRECVESTFYTRGQLFIAQSSVKSVLDTVARAVYKSESDEARWRLEQERGSGGYLAYLAHPGRNSRLQLMARSFRDHSSTLFSQFSVPKMNVASVFEVFADLFSDTLLSTQTAMSFAEAVASKADFFCSADLGVAEAMRSIPAVSSVVPLSVMDLSTNLRRRLRYGAHIDVPAEMAGSNYELSQLCFPSEQQE